MRISNNFVLVISHVVVWLSLVGCQAKAKQIDNSREQNNAKSTESNDADDAQNSDQEADKYPNSVSLFDGETLEGWFVTNFGGEGEVTVEDHQIVMEAGYPVSGINRDREEWFPTSNYEISLEAKRIEGIDFFCGLTFPVKESHCTLIVAGWAGATVGLSCIDDKDASSNDTTTLMDFKDDQWYEIKVEVTDEKINCWIDGEQVIEQPLEGRKINVRGDVTASRPLGLCAFESKVAYRNFSLKCKDKPPVPEKSSK